MTHRGQADLAHEKVSRLLAASLMCCCCCLLLLVLLQQRVLLLRGVSHGGGLDHPGKGLVPVIADECTRLDL